jgi:hypothetical protein
VNKKIHHINKQFIELHVVSESTAFALQNRIEVLSKETIPKMLESLFDSLCENEQYIIANKLEIDLGEIKLEQFEKEFSNRLIERLRNMLSKNETVSQMNTIADTTNNAENPFIINPQVHLIESLIFFILNGYLQWNHIEFSDEEIVALCDESNNEEANHHLHQLKIFLTSSDRHLTLFSKRLSSRVSEKISGKLFPLVSQLHKSRLKITEILSEIKLLKLKGSELKEIFLKTIVQSDIDQITETTYKLISEEIAILLISRYNKNEIADLLIALNVKLHTVSESEDKQSFIILTGLIKKLHALFANPETIYEDSIPQQAVKNYESEKLKNKKQDKNKKQIEQKIKKEDKPAEAEGLYIANAGLVLYHPFISEWFKSLNCFDSKGDWQYGKQQRAVRLLQLLVSGEVNCPEYELCLNKILCGLGLNDEIEPEIILSPEEIESAETLMKAVIKHWQALGESSIAGLQETFIQRTGKLFFENGSWQLHCEEKTVDILLNKLPWSFSIIKLPWMEQMLRVQWEIKSF